MLKRALVVTLLGSAITLGACEGTAVESIFGDTGVLSGGINQAGNGQFGRIISSQFEFLWPAVNASCGGSPRCSLGESRSEAVGSLSNGGSMFMLLSTENASATFNSTAIQTSGVRTAPLTVQNPSQYTALRLVLEWAFLTSRFTPATANDSAIVRVKAGNDSAVVFRVTSADLQSGRFPQRSGGCGKFTLFVDSVTFNNCTDWQSSSDIDLTAWKDRTFELHFIVSEAAPFETGQNDFPSMFLFRRFTIEGGK
ncbi:MAG TPA: hypothetical protein VKA54_18160 [Gemmatimonadaceae bacterium]|nr:hypothetical protein [Gemmatimonadaceae bacterium]